VTEHLTFLARLKLFQRNRHGIFPIGISLPTFQKKQVVQANQDGIGASRGRAENNKELEAAMIATNCGLAEEAWACPDMLKPLPIKISIFPSS
jgi:hypothetical protein